jgi:hypothetical protein
MGFFDKVGEFVGKGASYLGKKVKQGVRYGIKHSEKISNIAGQVEDIAGKVGDVAGVAAAGLAATGLEPLAGVAGGVAGIAKGVGKGAGAVKGVADKVTDAKTQAKKFGIDANQLADRFLG